MEKKRRFLNLISTEVIVVLCLVIGLVLCLSVFISSMGKQEDIKAVLLGIGCSLIASSFVLMITARYTVRYGNVKMLTEEWGITGIYETRQAMNVDSNIQLGKIKYNLDIVAWGLSGFRSVHDDLIRNKVHGGVTVRILCPHPDSQYVKTRSAEEGSTGEQISKNIRDLSFWVEDIQRAGGRKGKIEIRYYSALPHEHYMRVDENIYVGPYHYKKLSQQTVSFSFGYGKMYKYYTNYFNKLWNDEDFSQSSNTHEVDSA